MRVVAVAVARHGGHRRREQILLRHHRQLGHELARIAAGEHPQRAEPGRRGPLEQLHRRLRVVGDEGRRARTERGRDRPLLARLHADEREREPLALFRERAGGGRDPLSLGQ